jgi:hypothetical protein
VAAHLSRELQPVVSIATDSKDSTIIYAGTPHLPWKTVDDGEHWTSIHTGMVDDSDVFRSSWTATERGGYSQQRAAGFIGA